MTTDEARQLADDDEKRHRPRLAELDQSAGEDGMVCGGHGIGYPPPWPCHQITRATVLREQADEIDRLRAALLEIWELTNLPFTDADRHEIQRLALSTVRALTTQEDRDE